MPDRRATLKIIGAIGTTCAFPFSSDELYGQHVHPAPGAPSAYGEPKFFTPDEFRTLIRIADLIIPATSTPGAVGAGVPAYIDYVVNTNQDWRKLFRDGFHLLRERRFDDMAESAQVAELARYIDQPGDDLPTRFFRAVKSMTADGYYTSKIGLLDELGYRGNTVRDGYPSCEIPEH